MVHQWWHLEHPTRMALLRLWYISCTFSYPVYTVLNWKQMKPRRELVLRPETLEALKRDKAYRDGKLFH
ncbi:Protein F53F4.16 [Aphelenchoides avenae]|nr:Protein F53F4.16 [Aphelenchus avenae]